MPNPLSSPVQAPPPPATANGGPARPPVGGGPGGLPPPGPLGAEGVPLGALPPPFVPESGVLGGQVPPNLLLGPLPNLSDPPGAVDITRRPRAVNLGEMVAVIGALVARVAAVERVLAEERPAALAILRKEVRAELERVEAGVATSFSRVEARVDRECKDVGAKVDARYAERERYWNTTVTAAEDALIEVAAQAKDVRATGIVAGQAATASRAFGEKLDLLATEIYKVTAEVAVEKARAGQTTRTVLAEADKKIADLEKQVAQLARDYPGVNRRVQALENRARQAARPTR